MTSLNNQLTSQKKELSNDIEEWKTKVSMELITYPSDVHVQCVAMLWPLCLTKNMHHYILSQLIQ